MNKLEAKPRIFIGLTDVVSYYSGLKQGFDELGIDAVFVPLAQDRWSRPTVGNTQNWVLSLVIFVMRLRSTPFQSRLANVGYDWVLFPLTKLLLLLWAVLRYDVFVYGFATSFFDYYRELPFLRLLGKKIIYVFNGSDSRPPFSSGNFLPAHSTLTAADCVAATATRKSVIRSIERHAHLCVNHPPQAHFHERKFINHCFIGHPCKLQSQPPPPTLRTGVAGTVRIVHAPSKPGPKGTAVVRTLISKLQIEGIPIEYIEVTNRPNHEVLQELAHCDFVIDELYSDIPLAGLGAEAAFFRKPAVVCGYAHRELGRYAAKAGLPMALYVHPDELETTVRRLITDPAFRDDCGEAAHAFVSTQWSPRQVAARFLQMIAGEVPDEWWCDPKSICHLHGWGGTEQQMQEQVSRVIQVGGVVALQLSDKPEMEAAFVAFSNSRNTSCSLAGAGIMPA